MNMIDWAENEVHLACNLENPDRKDGEWDYGCACYESALKAYKSLMMDDHSRCSFGITVAILKRLMAGMPLTPIEDTDDIWSDGSKWSDNSYTTYQCKRRSSLFKDVYPDGHVKYHDNDYCHVVYEGRPDISWHSGIVSTVVHDMWPITMPYSPKESIKVVCAEELYDTNNGDFDTIIIRYAIKDGKRVDINRYFHEVDGRMKELTEAEYKELAANHVNLLGGHKK